MVSCDGAAADTVTEDSAADDAPSSAAGPVHAARPRETTPRVAVRIRLRVVVVVVVVVVFILGSLRMVGGSDQDYSLRRIAVSGVMRHWRQNKQWRSGPR
jgi:hypothetical protein